MDFAHAEPIFLQCLTYQLSTLHYQNGKRNASFLMHSTNNHLADREIGASIIYADHYYLEALLKLKHNLSMGYS